jgi:hypothetical protein
MPGSAWTRCTRATVGVATVGVAFALLPAPARAAVNFEKPKLSVKEVDHGLSASTYDVVVSGRLLTSEIGENQRLLERGFKFVVRLWGDDPVSDDLIRGPVELEPRLVGTTLYFRWPLPGLSRRTLDEDPAPFDADEIYAGVRLIDSGGNTRALAESNRWSAIVGVP